MANYVDDPWNLLDAALLAALREQAGQEGQENALHSTLDLFRLEFASEIDPWPLLEAAILMLAIALADHVGVDKALEVAQANHDRAVKRD